MAPDSAKRIRPHVDDLVAVLNLETMRMILGQCYELMDNLLGLLALDIKHPFRLLFEQANDPVPTKIDGGLDWIAITAVRMLRVEDYHG